LVADKLTCCAGSKQIGKFLGYHVLYLSVENYSQWHQDANVHKVHV